MKEIKKEIKKHANRENADKWLRFFKTGKGEYAEGDVILGICVPKQREIAKNFGKDLSFAHIQKLMNSKIHEERLIGLLILVERYEKGDEKEGKFIFDFYLKLAKHGRVNHWDLVDLSCYKIIGDYLLNKKDRNILDKLAISKNLWERRIAIVSTFAFIREGELNDTLRISKILLRDSHDLIHKAVGWMLREVGKKNQDALRDFLKDNYSILPRMTLRYAIEKFEEKERRKWLKKRRD